MRRPADNPFASRRIDGLSYRFHDSGIDELIATIAAAGGRGAVIGPHGSGKTTLLEELAQQLGGEIVRIRLNADTSNPAASVREHLPVAVDHRHSILFDGAERLGSWSWWRIHRRIRSAGSIVITSHRSGRLPTIYECRTDPELLIELVGELAPDGVDADLEELYRRYGGNIRLCLRELYDVWARR